MTTHSMHGTLLHQSTHDRTLLPIKTGVHCSRIAPVLGWTLLRAKGPYPFSFLLQSSVFLKYVKYVTSFVTGIGSFMVAVQQYCTYFGNVSFVKTFPEFEGRSQQPTCKVV